MKHYPHLFFWITLIRLIASSNSGQCQNGYQFNYNVDNGLPSNHVYKTITDHLGYIWLSTQEGVVRYNGYEFKIFNNADGLPTQDVWHLVEDSRGHIWLGCITDEMGYIYNNKYYGVGDAENSHSIYPHGLRATGNSIIFMTHEYKGIMGQFIGIGNEKKIRYYFADSIDFGNHRNILQKEIFPCITENSDSLLMYDSCIFRFSIRQNHITTQLIAKLQDPIFNKNIYFNDYIINHDFILSYPRHDSLAYYNLNNGKLKVFKLNNFQDVSDVYPYHWNKNNQNMLYALSKDSIERICIDNDTFTWNKSLSIAQLCADKSIDGSNVSDIFEDEFWGTTLSTFTNGITENLPITPKFRKETSLDLKYFSYIGNDGNKTFWWNTASKTLAELNGDNYHIESIKYSNLLNVKHISRCNKDSFLVFALHSYWLLNNKTKLLDCSDIFGNNCRLAICDTINNYYITSIFAFKNVNLNPGNKQNRYFDNERYSDLVFDTFRKSYWAYSSFKIFIHNNLKDTIISKKQLRDIGIQRIEKIAIDGKYGNIFILENILGGYKLLRYNYETNTCHEILANFNFKGAHLTINDGYVIASGKPGIIFCKITGKEQIASPIAYWNIKNKFYSSVNDMVATGNRILLNTDKGVYSVPMPGGGDTCNTTNTSIVKYKFIIYTKDTIFDIRFKDTIVFNPKNQKVQFDVINPFGNGRIKYSCILPGEQNWHELNGNELILPQGLLPGTYYSIYIHAIDDAWRSDKMRLVVYIQPYWWQVVFQSSWFWLGVSIVVLGLLALIVFITQKIVTKGNKKRNMQLELELKSVYSQINPHFIFNSLATIMFLIKKKRTDKAYENLAKFSNLLRAYIKSARNKYISLASEIENLNDYIQLQQARFVDKFDYSILVDEEIEKESMMIPSLLLQPIVENAIDHGLFHRETKGYLKIEFKKISLSNEICCIIDDNGIGRKKSKLLSKSSVIKTESYGEQLISDLVTIFNKYEKISINIKYIDKTEPDTGTTVIVTIKYLLHAK